VVLVDISGNLRYHSYVKGVTRVNDNKNCSQILLDPSGQMHLLITGAPPASSTEAYIVLPAYTGCSTVNLTTDVAYCSVFGDPHVLTDKGHFQTCSIYGAYPLIENRHLASKLNGN
jgi:Repulsive guidance molecule (RGM) N-terminus